uniref:Secreted protein n=2 Tax=Caenorhabditis tropicalis TaxID=1561998 RepID=A0A1I7U964_9PELO
MIALLFVHHVPVEAFINMNLGYGFTKKKEMKDYLWTSRTLFTHCLQYWILFAQNTTVVFRNKKQSCDSCCFFGLRSGQSGRTTRDGEKCNLRSSRRSLLSCRSKTQRKRRSNTNICNWNKIEFVRNKKQFCDSWCCDHCEVSQQNCVFKVASARHVGSQETDSLRPACLYSLST